MFYNVYNISTVVDTDIYIKTINKYTCWWELKNVEPMRCMIRSLKSTDLQTQSRKQHLQAEDCRVFSGIFLKYSNPLLNMKAKLTMNYHIKS